MTGSGKKKQCPGICSIRAQLFPYYKGAPEEQRSIINGNEAILMYLSCAPHFQPEKTQQPDSQGWLNTNSPERAVSFGKGGGVSCGLAIHFSLFGFVSAPMQQSACLSYRRAACSQPVSLQPPPTNCSQPVCHRKLHFHLQATHEQTRPAST